MRPFNIQSDFCIPARSDAICEITWSVNAYLVDILLREIEFGAKVVKLLLNVRISKCVYNRNRSP